MGNKEFKLQYLNRHGAQNENWINSWPDIDVGENICLVGN